MSSKPLSADRTTRPRRRIQFTVRTFLAAAVLIALFAAAFKVPAHPEPLQWAAFATLIWITVVGIYRILHAEAAVVACIAGAIAAGVGWGAFFFCETRGDLVPAILTTIAYGFSWGAGYGVAISLVRAVQHAWRWVSPARRAATAAAPPKEAPRLALIMASLQVLVFLAALVLYTGREDPYGFGDFFAWLVIIGADFPLVGLLTGGDIPNSAPAALGLAILPIPFHALLGYLVGYVLDRRNRA